MLTEIDLVVCKLHRLISSWS